MSERCSSQCPEIKEAGLSLVMMRYTLVAEPVAASARWKKLVLTSKECDGPKQLATQEALPFSKLRGWLGMQTTRETTKLICCNPYLQAINEDPTTAIN
ncbi:MAG TPA: hypothetical protein VLG27_03735 [Candidatus Saccharimonadia bacterium]|nr:hypothetical protein [Candidatus Saccharimonadia bacterium]